MFKSANIYMIQIEIAILKQQNDYNSSKIGQTLPILFERQGRHDGQLIGRSPYNQSVSVNAPQSFIGTIRQVIIDSNMTHSLSGKVVDYDEFVLSVGGGNSL